VKGKFVLSGSQELLTNYSKEGCVCDVLFISLASHTLLIQKNYLKNYMSIATNNVIAKIAAVVAGLGLVAMSFAYAAPAAKADTASDNAALIASLMAQIEALKASMGGSTSAGATATFSKDLTIGSTGADVTALQKWLISKGHPLAAGATGYFGAQTKAALAAWQAANGVAPASGYFGPITRAKVNAAGGSTGSTGGTTDTSSLQGGEGSLDINGNVSADVESEVDEGDSDVQVLGFEVEAQDSDVMIERVDVEFTVGSGGSSKLDDYIDGATLWMGSKKLASMDVSKADEDDNDVYSFRFAGLKGIVKEDDQAELYVSVDAVSNVDSSDTNVDISVDVPADGIRAVDAAGISETYAIAGEITAETFNIVEPTAGDLNITEADNSPEATIVSVDDENDTNDVTILSFDLEADEQDILITDLPVGLVTSEDAGVDGPVKRVMLQVDGKTLDTVTIPSSAGVSYQALFEDIDYTVDNGDTVTFDVVVDLNDTDLTTFASGTTLYATSSNVAAWDAEDEQGDSITPDGSATGETMTFFEDSIVVTLDSVTTTKSTSDTSGVGDQATFKIKFDVKAVGDDMYLDRSVTADFGRDGSGAAGSGFQFATTSDSTTGTTTVQSISASDTDTDDTATLYKIDEGKTRTFTLTVVATAGIDGFVGVQLTGINWTTVAGSAVAPNFYTSNLNDFKSDLESVNLF
jgi:peptidoglycan hydrolase-like protein with peptidoglycan-binding domain